MKNRFNFLNVRISVINLQKAVELIVAFPFKAPAYICFPDASVVSDASKDPKLTAILNNAYLTMPDGKPSQLAARLQGYHDVSTVSGFHLCHKLLKTELTHYFYGGSQELLARLRENITASYPKARILGYKSPPFVRLDDIEGNVAIAEDIRYINSLQPDIVWIGISSPKQDYLMHHFYHQLDKTMMLGVGGVFLYLADESLKSPEWMKKAGLRWLFRLSKEPARLWPKYLGTFRFLVKNAGFFFRAFIAGRLPVK